MKLGFIAAAAVVGFTSIAPAFADSITTTTVEPLSGSTTTSSVTTVEPSATIVEPAPVLVTPSSTTNETVVVDKRKRHHLLHLGIPFVHANVL